MPLLNKDWPIALEAVHVLSSGEAAQVVVTARGYTCCEFGSSSGIRRLLSALYGIGMHSSSDTTGAAVIVFSWSRAGPH